MQAPGERCGSGSDKILSDVCKRAYSDRSVSQEESTTDFCVNDYLSRQPNLCLFKIFNHLTRDDIYNMEVVSKRMREIAIDKSLEKIKWEGGNLILYQTTRGYGFHYVVTHAGYPTNLPSSFRYETWIENGEIAEKREVDADPILEDFIDHGLLIPDELYAALKIILCRYAITSLKIYDIYFDSLNLFEKLGATLKEQKIDILECVRMRCNAMIDETEKSFVHFIKNIAKVDMRESDEVPSLISETFLLAIAESELRDFRERHSDRHVRLDMSLLQRIVKIDTLYAKRILFDVPSIAKFCVMYMDARAAADYPTDYPTQGCWLFTADESVTEEVLSQNIRESDYEYKEELGDYHLDQRYEHYIVRKEDGMRACFHRWARYEGNDGAQPLVAVFFMDRKRWDELSAEAKAKQKQSKGS